MSDWKETKTKEGKIYYYNRETKETRWQAPLGILTKVSSFNEVSPEMEMQVDRLLENEQQLTIQLESILQSLRLQAANKFIKKAKSLFDDTDKEGSGKLDVEEFQGLMHILGTDLTAEQAEQQIRSVDINHDGKLDFLEFCAFLGY